VTIPASMMASGSGLVIAGGTTKILVVSGYPYNGLFVYGYGLRSKVYHG